MWSWSDPEFLGVFIAFLAAIGGALQYIWNKGFEYHQFKFEQYHKAIKDLVERENLAVPMMLDRQIALIFELRHFKKYYPVTYRILNGLKVTWSDYGPPEKNKRLIKEIDCTLNAIERCLVLKDIIRTYLLILPFMILIIFLMPNQL